MSILKPLIAVGLSLALGGTLHHAVHRSRAGLDARYRPPAMPLSEIPTKLGSYVFRKDMPVSPEVLQVANVDAFLHRQYSDGTAANPLVLYIGYWGRQNVAMGHGPEVCFPAVGWEIERPASRKQVQFMGPDGATETAEIGLHRFRREEVEGPQRVAVGFVAVVGGEFRATSRGTFFHTPSTRRGGFLAQIEVLTPVKGEAWSEAEDRILDFIEIALPHAARSLFEPEIERGDENMKLQQGDR